MKSKRLFIALAVIACLFAFEGALLVAPATADVAPGPSPSSFSAGDWINQGGFVVGCKCPKLSGPCVCQYDNAQ